jgi:hypothetical protein
MLRRIFGSKKPDGPSKPLKKHLDVVERLTGYTLDPNLILAALDAEYIEKIIAFHAEAKEV